MRLFVGANVREKHSYASSSFSKRSDTVLVAKLVFSSNTDTEIGIILSELVKLWGGSRSLARMMFGGFAVVHSVTLVSFVLTAINMKGKAIYLSSLRICLLSPRRPPGVLPGARL